MIQYFIFYVVFIVDGPPPRQSYRHVKVKDILKSFKWRDLSKDIKDMLTIHRLKIMEWDYDLIDSACNASITANLNQGNPDDAATTLIEYFGKNHDGDALLKFCKFLRDEAKEAGEAPRLKDLAGKIERAVKAKGHSGTIALFVGVTSVSNYNCQKNTHMHTRTHAYTHTNTHTHTHTHTHTPMSLLGFSSYIHIL